MTLPLLILSGADAATSLALASRPIYLLEWAQETDRFYAASNGPVCWSLTRFDGADIDAPEEGVLTVTLQGGEAETFALDLDGDESGYTLAALFTFETGGSYRLRISLAMPDGTIVVNETPVYIL